MSPMFSRSRTILVLSALAVAAAIGHARAQSNTPSVKIDVETLGPKVGDSLPDFSLRDQHGEARTLKSLLGPTGAVVVFFRSADW